MSPLQEDAIEDSSPSGKKRGRGGDIVATEHLFEQSNMSEQERRRVRHKQRRLHEKIEHGNDDDDDDDDNGSNMRFLSKARKENNQLFDSVRYTREAVLDADNAGLIVEKTLMEVDKLRQVARFDADKLARALRSKLSKETTAGRQFNWTLLGSECGICFNAPPAGVRFLAGSIDMEGQKVARKARAKRANNKQDNTAPEVRPEVMDKEASKGDADALSAAEKVMKELGNLLKKKSKEQLKKNMEEHGNADEGTQKRLEEHGTEVDGVKFLVNPRSFTQTVENIFNFSFLVKKGRAAIGVRGKMEADAIRRPGLWVQYRQANDQEPSESTQAVVSFSMADWRRICEAHKLEHGDIPHRTGSRHGRAVSQSQRE